MPVSLFGSSFLTLQILGVMKKMKVAQEGPMYTQQFLAAKQIFDLLYLTLAH